MVSAAELAILLRVKDEASGKLDAVGKSGMSLGSKLKLGALGAGIAVAGIGVAAVKMAADFDKSMREVNTLIGLSEDEFKVLKQDVLALSSEVGIAANEAVPALYQAISAGIPRENAIDFMRVASKAAIGGVTDLETAVDGLTTALNAFQLPVSEAEHAADVLFQAVKSGKTTMSEMSTSLFQVAPLAKAAGVSLEEAAAAMAALTTAGVPTAVAATQIRAAIQGLLKPSEEMTALFQNAGFASGELAIKQLGLQGALKIVTDATGGNIGQLQLLMGSVEAVGATLSLTGAQAGTFTTTLDTMRGQSGQAQEAFDEMNKSASRQFEILKNKLNVSMIELGEAALPGIILAMETLAPMLSGLASFLKTHLVPAIEGFIWWLEKGARVVGMLRVAVRLLRGQNDETRASIHRISDSLRIFTTQLGQAKIHSNAVTQEFFRQEKATYVIGTATQQATQAFEDARNALLWLDEEARLNAGAWDLLGENAESSTGKLKTAAELAEDAARALARQLSDVDSAIGAVLGIPLAGTTEFEDSIFNAEMRVKELELALLRMGGKTAEGTKPLVEQLETARERVTELKLEFDLQFEPMKRTLERIAKPVEEISFQNAIDTVIELKTRFLALAGEVPSAIETFRAQIVQKVSDVAAKFGLVVDHQEKIEKQAGESKLVSHWWNVYGAIDAARDALGKFYSYAVWMSGQGVPMPQIPSWEIPGFAQGAIVTRPTLAMIGERGPEAVVPLSGRGMGGGAINVTVNVQGSVIAERDLAANIRRELLKMGGRNVSVGLA